jgi:predicted ester cyclase
VKWLLPGQQQGREGLKQVISAFRTAFPDIHWVIDEMVKGMVVDRVVAGKIVESRILMDSLGMMRQLGVIPE